MNFNEYQEQAHKTAQYMDKVDQLLNCVYCGNDNDKNIRKFLAISYVGFGLGEVGELQGKLKKVLRDNGGVISKEVEANIKKELGDIQWYVAEMATLFGWNLADVAKENLEKLASRAERGVIGGSGDNR